MEEQIKAPEKMQLSDKETVTLSEAQFKTLVIRILFPELVEYGHKIEEVKGMLSEIRKIYREPDMKGRKVGLKLMIWSRRKK